MTSIMKVEKANRMDFSPLSQPATPILTPTTSPPPNPTLIPIRSHNFIFDIYTHIFRMIFFTYIPNKRK